MRLYTKNYKLKLINIKQKNGKVIKKHATDLRNNLFFRVTNKFTIKYAELNNSGCYVEIERVRWQE